MGDIARLSLSNEEILYKLFGVNAELLIDHAWGCESCLIEDIKKYKPQSSSLGSGQVLSRPYDYAEARLIVREMADALSYDLVEKGLVCDQIVLNISYDTENLQKSAFSGEVAVDFYGRQVPKSTHGSVNLGRFTSSARLITEKSLELFERISDRTLTVRRVNICANHTVCETSDTLNQCAEQIDMFTDSVEQERVRRAEEEGFVRERKMQDAVLLLRKKYGKNAVLKGMNYEEGATTRQRNGQIGGHKA